MVKCISVFLGFFFVAAHHLHQNNGDDNGGQHADHHAGKGRGIGVAHGVDGCQQAGQTSVYIVLGVEEADDQRTDGTADAAADEGLLQA